MGSFLSEVAAARAAQPGAPGAALLGAPDLAAAAPGAGRRLGRYKLDHSGCFVVTASAQLSFV